MCRSGPVGGLQACTVAVLKMKTTPGSRACCHVCRWLARIVGHPTQHRCPRCRWVCLAASMGPCMLAGLQDDQRRAILGQLLLCCTCVPRRLLCIFQLAVPAACAAGRTSFSCSVSSRLMPTLQDKIHQHASFNHAPRSTLPAQQHVGQACYIRHVKALCYVYLLS